MTNMHFEYEEDRIKINGSTACKWGGVQSTDRIKLKAEMFKFRRGDWQLTPLTMHVQDFCSFQFIPGYSWYSAWSQHIAANERKCLNNYGHIYHYKPYVMDNRFDHYANVEGRHKVVIRFEAYDMLNQKRANDICFQVIGEYFKVK
ncbi:uncharacterized protein [Musca autumnalis]|uniref:uncharacterized protein n=1 Tax=Musca autumnalis TaxID=221902 RepID=UPI003CEFFFD7